MGMYGSIGFTRRKTRYEKPLTVEQEYRLKALRKQVAALQQAFMELPIETSDIVLDEKEVEIQAIETQIQAVYAE